MADPLTLQQIVDRALDHALAHGYQDVKFDTLENVAINLIDYDADLFDAIPDGVSVMELMPLIECWRAAQIAKSN